jgi:hypothetical protein
MGLSWLAALVLVLPLHGLTKQAFVVFAGHDVARLGR